MSANDKYIRIRSGDGTKTYTLVIFTDGTITCDCGDFTFRRRRGRDECKHISLWKEDNLFAGMKTKRGYVNF